MSWRRRSPSSSLSNVAKYLRSSTRSTTSTGWTSGALSSPLSSRSSSASLLSPSSASSLPSSSRSSSSSSRSAPPSPKLSLTIPSRRSSSRDRDSLSSPTSPSLARGSSPSRSRDSISSPTSPALARSSPRSRDSISSPTSPALARPSLRSRDSPSLARSSTSRRSPPTSPTSPSVPRSSPATLPRYSPSSPMSPSLPRSSASTSRRSPSSPTSPTASLKFGHGSSRSNGPSYPNREQHSSGIEERRRMRREHEERRQKLEDCGLQLSHTGTYLDLESSIDEQKEDFVGFNRESRKHSVIIRTDLSVRVHACIEKLLNSTGRELRRALFSLKQIFQDDQDLVHEFVSAEGLACLIKVGSSADQNYQNYILRALGQVMLYVDGMNGVIEHNETIQWLYSLIASKPGSSMFADTETYRLVLKTALKLLVVFIEYAESNAQLLLQAVDIVDKENMQLPWANVMKLLNDDGQDSEVLVYAMTLINKTVHNIPDQDTFYDLTDALEQQGIEVVTQRYMGRAGSDLDLVEQLRIYEMGLKQEDGDIDIPVSQKQNLRKTPRKSLDPSENGHARKSIRHSLRPTAEYDVPKRRSLDASMDEMQNGSSRRRRRRPRYSADEGQPPVLAETTPTEESKPPLSNGTEALIGSLEERRERIRAARQRDNQSRDKNGTTTPTKQSNGEIPMVNGESVNQQAETHPRRTSQPNRSLPETNGASHPKRSSSSSDAESKEDQFEMRRMRRRLQYLQTKNHDHKKSLKDQEFESNTWPRRRRRCHQIEAIKEESREEEDEDVSIADGETEQDVNGPSASKVRRSSNPSLTSHTSLEEPMEISKPTETAQENERLAGKEEKEEETVDVEEKLKTVPRSKLTQKQSSGSLSPRPFESPWAQQESSDSSFSQCTPFAPTSSLYGDIARWAHVANPQPVYIRRPSYIIRDPRTGREMTPDGKLVELKSKTHAKRLLGDQKDVKAKTQDRPWKTKLAQRMEEEKKREEAKKAKLKEMEEMRKAKEQERARQFKKDMGSLSSKFEGKEGDKSGGSKGTGDKTMDAAPLRKKTSDEDSPWRKKLMEKLEEDKRKTEERRKKQQARLEEERKKREEERKRDEERRKEERGKKKKWNELVQSRLEEEQKKAEQEQKKKQEFKKKAEPKVEEKLSENKTEELKPWEKRLAARLEKERQLEEEKKKKEEAEKMLRDAKILEKLAETGEELKPWQKRLAARLAEQQKEADAKKKVEEKKAGKKEEKKVEEKKVEEKKEELKPWQKRINEKLAEEKRKAEELKKKEEELKKKEEELKRKEAQQKGGSKLTSLSSKFDSKTDDRTKSGKQEEVLKKDEVQQRKPWQKSLSSLSTKFEEPSRKGEDVPSWRRSRQSSQTTTRDDDADVMALLSGGDSKPPPSPLMSPHEASVSQVSQDTSANKTSNADVQENQSERRRSRKKEGEKEKTPTDAATTPQRQRRYRYSYETDLASPVVGDDDASSEVSTDRESYSDYSRRRRRRQDVTEDKTAEAPTSPVTRKAPSGDNEALPNGIASRRKSRLSSLGSSMDSQPEVEGGLPAGRRGSSRLEAAADAESPRPGSGRRAGQQTGCGNS
ncbi:uncharacterized protein [Amphiura filiformis]|uniref:uncharacterized protein isoform X3 n=1 Tax=Amphiura filiformis TaxID=82378 RepID=UPI003B2103F1